MDTHFDTTTLLEAVVISYDKEDFWQEEGSLIEALFF